MDFFWFLVLNVYKFEIFVDLVILEVILLIVFSLLSFVGGIDLLYVGVDGIIFFFVFFLSLGLLKDFKLLNYFINVIFKCGEMEFEWDINCLLRRFFSDSIEGVSFDMVINRRDVLDNYVKWFERKIFCSMGDIENEDFFLSFVNGICEGLNCRDVKMVGNLNIKMDIKGNYVFGLGFFLVINSLVGFFII